MGKRISIRADLSVEELERRSRPAQDPVARSQWQIVWLLARGRPSEQVGETTGYSVTWIYTVARRYTADGEQGIGDGRHGNPGGQRILSEEQQAELDRALEGAAPAGRRWTAGGGAGGRRSRWRPGSPSAPDAGWGSRRAGALCAG